MELRCVQDVSQAPRKSSQKVRTLVKDTERRAREPKFKFNHRSERKRVKRAKKKQGNKGNKERKRKEQKTKGTKRTKKNEVIDCTWQSRDPRWISRLGLLRILLIQYTILPILTIQPVDNQRN